ncbi:5-formyltetrahydrofolate cyclo-ligase [Bacillus sp. SL00103]
MGFGAYYDRYLADFHGVTIALCLSLQQIKHVPSEAHDIPVSIIVSEKGTLYQSKSPFIVQRTELFRVSSGVRLHSYVQGFNRPSSI